MPARVLYGHLIGNGSDPSRLFIGYLIGAGVMVLGGVVEIVLGIAAEGKALEDIAKPLSVVRRAAGAVTATRGTSASGPGRLGPEAGSGR